MRFGFECRYFWLFISCFGDIFIVGKFYTSHVLDEGMAANNLLIR